MCHLEKVGKIDENTSETLLTVFICRRIDFYLDLAFYHSILKCHVLIDLKVGKLTHGDIGQMDSYIQTFDALCKNEDDIPTIGIILCSQKNEAIVKYSVLNDAQQVFASRYRFALPTAEELRNKLEVERRRIEDRQYEEEVTPI